MFIERTHHMKKWLLFFTIILATNLQAAPDSTKAEFTQDEFNVIVGYLANGSIPARADSATLSNLNSLRDKIDAVRTGKESLEKLQLTLHEKSIILYLMRSDLTAAVALLRLQQKLIPDQKPKR